jgi:AraC family transcriptional regulator
MRTVVEWTGRRQGCAPHEAPLSVHCGFAGRELYRTRDGLYAVEPGRLLVINAGQIVSTHVAGREVSAGFSVLFPAALVAEVHRARTTADERLLDDPEGGRALAPRLAERTHLLDARLGRCLEALRAAARRGAAPAEEPLHGLLDVIFGLDAEAGRAADRVPAARASTRAELHRRLQRARDYLDASFDRTVTLAELGRVAAVSPHRLLRLFRDSFGLTPRRHVHERRMGEAARLLRATEAPVGEVAHRVGFDSFGSFSAAFRRHFGVPPRQYRAR